MPNTIVNQPTAASLQTTDYFLTWQGGQSPSTRKTPVSNLATYYAALASANTFADRITVSSGGIGVTGNSSITGTLSVSSTFTISGGGLVVSVGGAQITGGGGWSSSNVGKQLLLSTVIGASNPALGIVDANQTNLVGIYNNAGTLTIARMPAYSDSVTAPSAGVTSILGTLTVSAAFTVSSGGAAITGNSTIAGTLGGITGLTVASGGASVTGGLTVATGGAAITGNSTITGTLTGLTGLIVASGGASITGNTGIAGTLTGLTGLIVASGGASITGNTGIAGTLTGLTGLTVASGNATVSTGNLAVSTGSAAIANGLFVTAGGLTVSAGGMAVTGNSSVAGTLTATAGTSGTQVVNFGQFTQTSSAAGFPGATQFRYGTSASSDAGGIALATFSPAFTTGCYAAVGNALTTSSAISVSFLTASSCTFTLTDAAGAPVAGALVSFIAVGH